RCSDLLAIEQNVACCWGTALKFLETLNMQFDRFFWVEIDEFEPLKEAVYKRLTNLRPLFDRRPFTRGDNAAHFDAVVLVEHGVEFDRLGKEGRSVATVKFPDLFFFFFRRTPHQPRRIHTDDPDFALIDPGSLYESWPELEFAAADIEPDCLSFQV